MLQLPEAMKRHASSWRANARPARPRCSAAATLRRRSASSCPKRRTGRWSRSCSANARRSAISSAAIRSIRGQDELATLVGTTLGDLERVFAERRNNRGEAQVVLAGLVTAVRRRGDNQAFVQLEDTRAGSSAPSSARPSTSSRRCCRATASSWSRAACARTLQRRLLAARAPMLGLPQPVRAIRPPPGADGRPAPGRRLGAPAAGRWPASGPAARRCGSIC